MGMTDDDLQFKTTLPVPDLAWLQSRHDTRVPEAPLKVSHRIRLQKEERRQPEGHRPRNHEYVANVADPRREMVEQIIEMIANKGVMRVNDVSQPPEEQKMDIMIL
jgi:hypothetical protein